MKKSRADKSPAYIPVYYRVFLMFRKLYRQGMVRRGEKRMRLQGADSGLVPDENGVWSDLNVNPGSDVINKSARWLDEDMLKPEVKKVSDGIEALKKELKSKGLYYCSPTGIFMPQTYMPENRRTKHWENCWSIAHAGVKKGDVILDIGGASTIFSFYLASLGCKVIVVDNDWGNCGTIFNTNYVAQKMGWDLMALDRDIAKPLPFKDGYFDKVFSICVIEHLTSDVRRYMMREVNRVIKSGGIAGFTTDYDHKRPVLLFDKGLRFAYRDKLQKDIIEPSQMTLMGNSDLVDAIPKDENFLGAFFLKKS